MSKFKIIAIFEYHSIFQYENFKPCLQILKIKREGLSFLDFLNKRISIQCFGLNPFVSEYSIVQLHRAFVQPNVFIQM